MTSISAPSYSFGRRLTLGELITLRQHGPHVLLSEARALVGARARYVEGLTGEWPSWAGKRDEIPPEPRSTALPEIVPPAPSEAPESPPGGLSGRLCDHCGTALPPRGPRGSVGRPARFCGGACREAARRARLKAAAVGSGSPALPSPTGGGAP